MNTQIQIDPTRISSLQQTLDGAFAAAAKAGDELNGLVRERAKLDRDAEALRLQEPRSREAGADKKRQLEDIARRRAALVSQINEAKAAAEAARERQQAAGELFTRCNEYLETAR